jgi:hypothetical protein
MSNVLVLFQADTEHTEQMALAVSVGAVEAEGNIRLRRLAAEGAPEVGHKGYGKLHEADLIWADTVVVGVEGEDLRAGELDGLLGLLTNMDWAKLAGKRAWSFGPKGFATLPSGARWLVDAALREAGFLCLGLASGGGDLMEQMKEAGRRSAKHSD